jgi:hypothetical protein
MTKFPKMLDTVCGKAQRFSPSRTRRMIREFACSQVRLFPTPPEERHNEEKAVAGLSQTFVAKGMVTGTGIKN